jgi:hypothetical protein
MCSCSYILFFSACEEWNQDGGATHTSSGSSVMTSPSTHMTSELCPWAQNVQSPGLYVALSYFHDLPTMQPSFNLCSLFPISNGIALTLNQKKLNHNLIHCPRLYYTSFPHHGSVPISWLRLGTKSYYGNEAKSLNLSPEYQISTHVSEGSTQFVSEINLVSISILFPHSLIMPSIFMSEFPLEESKWFSYVSELNIGIFVNVSYETINYNMVCGELFNLLQKQKARICFTG